MELVFTVPGNPQGRVHVMPGRSSKGKMYARPSGSKSGLELKAAWRVMVREAAAQAMAVWGWEQVQSGALSLQVEFIRKRRGGDYWKGPHAEPRCWQGLDVDNLLKALVDSLDGLVFANDAQISDMAGSKRYAQPGEEPHATVRFGLLGEWY